MRRGALPIPRSALDRPAGRRCALGSARARHDPPRHQARQHHDHRARPREGNGLRAGDHRPRRRDRRRGDRHGLTSPGSVLGTVPYMSPEQVRGEALDARTDLFSVGVVLYELVTGHQPFAAPSSAGTLSAILTEEPQPLGRYSKDATAELERIVAKALRKDQEARYQTAKDLLIDLRALEDEVRRTSTGARSGPVTGTPISGTAPVASSVPASAPQIIATDAVATNPPSAVASVAGARRWRRVAAVAAVVAIAAASFWLYRSRSHAAWARAQIPRIEALVEARDLVPAYDLAVQARRYLPTDPVLARLMPIVSDLVSVTTTPAGATVYLTRSVPNEPGRPIQRQRIGSTPIDTTRDRPRRLPPDDRARRLRACRPPHRWRDRHGWPGPVSLAAGSHRGDARPGQCGSRSNGDGAGRRLPARRLGPAHGRPLQARRLPHRQIRGEPPGLPRICQRRRIPQAGVLEAPVRRERSHAVVGGRDEGVHRSFGTSRSPRVVAAGVSARAGRSSCDRRELVRSGRLRRVSREGPAHRVSVGEGGAP